MTGVVGVCRVLSYFWEMVPAAVIKSLLIRLIRDLAWDASAIGVRVAVLQVYRVDIVSLQCTVSIGLISYLGCVLDTQYTCTLMSRVSR